jgi:hypothetical protein
MTKQQKIDDNRNDNKAYKPIDVFESIIMMTIFFVTFIVITIAISNIQQRIVGYRILKNFYSESQIQDENLKVFYGRNHEPPYNRELQVSNGDILPDWTRVKYYASMWFLMIFSLFVSAVIISLLGTFVLKNRRYLFKRFETIVGIIIGKRKFSFGRKQGTPLKLRFQYEQSDGQFTLRHQHYRFYGISMFVFFAIVYFYVFLTLLMPMYYYDEYILPPFIIIPVIVFFGFLIFCLYFCTCRESWTLDVNGLTRNFNSIFYSSTDHIPFNDLLSIQYVEHAQSKKHTKPKKSPHVVAKSYCDEITIYSGKLRNVSAEECQYLADAMQKVLSTLQKDKV